MRVNFESPVIYVGFIRVLSLLLPADSRVDWRREWEAEIVNHWRRLQKWNRLNMKSKIDLTARVAGATRDVTSFQHGRLLVLAGLNILVALTLGFGAVQEFLLGGIRGGQLQPFVLSSAAILVSALFIISAVAMMRRLTAARRLVLLTGASSMLVHIYGALPPHRNMGYPALLIGAGYALVMMLVYLWKVSAKSARVNGSWR